MFGDFRPRRLAALGALLALPLLACDDILEVSDPSRFTDDALDNPAALPAVANGVEGRLQVGGANNGGGGVARRAIILGLLSDELMHTGTWAEFEDNDKGRYRYGDTPEATASGAAYATIRLEAQRAGERIQRVLGDTANRTKMMAQVKLVEGFSNLLMGMSACEGVLQPNGPAVSDTAAMEAAIAPLTEAITIATAANQTFYVNAARAARARANLFTGKYDAALADAQAIPVDFVYAANHSDQGTSNPMVTLIHYTENKAAGIDQRRWAQVDSINGFLNDIWTGENDPRMPIFHRVGNRLGVNGVTKFFSQDKYKTRSDDVPMVHGKEMLLIQAEVHWRKNDLDAAIAKLNENRALVGLDPFTKAGAWTSQEVFDRLLEERFATLFLEGQRANDLYRFNLFPQVIGTGYFTKWPISPTEARNNPSVGEPRSCPKVS